MSSLVRRMQRRAMRDMNYPRGSVIRDGSKKVNLPWPRFFPTDFFEKEARIENAAEEGFG